MKIKRTLIPVAFIVIASVALNSCNQTPQKNEKKSGVEHYRSLLFSETPFDIERGTHMISDGESESVNNYMFTYDDQGRLASVEYSRGSELLTYGSLGGAAKITYTYDGNTEVKSFFKKDGEQVESGGVYTYEYTLDDSGFRKALRFLDRDGNPIENRNGITRYEWSKLDNGMIKELRYNLANEETVMNPFCPFYELRFEYDKNGYVTRMSNYQADTLYNCTAENCGDIGVSYFEFENNESGDLLSFSVHNTVGQLSNLYWGWAKRVNKVDKNGYVTETAMFDQDDEFLSGKNVPITQYTYDEHGALIEARSLNSDMILINNPNNGVAITKYEYDEKGNRTEVDRLDKDSVEVVNE